MDIYIRGALMEYSFVYMAERGEIINYFPKLPIETWYQRVLALNLTYDCVFTSSPFNRVCDAITATFLPHYNHILVILPQTQSILCHQAITITHVIHHCQCHNLNPDSHGMWNRYFSLYKSSNNIFLSPKSKASMRAGSEEESSSCT